MISKTNIFFWEFSNGRLESSFMNPSKKSWPEVRKNFPNVHQGFEKKIVKMLLWTPRMQLWHPRRKHFDNAKQFRSGVQKRFKKYKFCRKNVFLQLVFEHMEFSFANLSKKIITKRRKLFAYSARRSKNSLLLLKKLLLTSRRQFWKRRKVFRQEPKSFCSLCEKHVRKKILQKVRSFTKLVLQTLRTLF